MYHLGSGRGGGRWYEYSWMDYCCLGSVGRHGDMSERSILLSVDLQVPILAFAKNVVALFATLIGVACGGHETCRKYLGLSRVRKLLGIDLKLWVSVLTDVTTNYVQRCLVCFLLFLILFFFFPQKLKGQWANAWHNSVVGSYGYTEILWFSSVSTFQCFQIHHSRIPVFNFQLCGGYVST
jgi:hypothetical protein